MSVFWLIALAAAVCVMTALWIKESLTVAALKERLARRDHDIARLDSLLLIYADRRWREAKKGRNMEAARDRSDHTWVA